jgi:hypothetical protein
MSLIEPNPSPAAMLALFARWADFAGPSDPSLNTLLYVHPEQHNMQVVYALGLQDLMASGLTNARKVGWRFLAASALRQAVAANLAQEGDEAPQMTALTRGAEIASAIRAAQRVREFPPAKDPKYEYELRVLKIPGVLLEVFWLKARTGSDLVVPYFALFCDQLNVMRVLQVDEFLNIVKPLVQKRLRNSQRTETGKGSAYDSAPSDTAYAGKDSGNQPQASSATSKD